MSKHKHLAQTWMFWIALLVPIGAGGILALVIVSGTALGQGCASSQCVQNFFSHFKFPITIMGLSVPFVAMWAAVHRSIEVSAQTEEAIRNNRFGNYLKHREGFEKLMRSWGERLGESKAPVVVQPSLLYMSLFPKSGFQRKDWYGEPDQEFVSGIERDVRLIMDQISGDSFDFEEFFEGLSTLFIKLGFNFKRYRPLHLSQKTSVIIFVPAELGGTEGIIKLVAECFSMVEMIRSYIGVNNSSDLNIGPYIGRLYSRVELGSHQYVTINHIFEG